MSDFAGPDVERDMSIDLLPQRDARPRMTDRGDLQFLYQQAHRYVTARPWERLADKSLYLDLKVGSWLEACFQHISNGPRTVGLLFPGHRTLLDLQAAGLSEPPAGTIFVELIDEPSSSNLLREIVSYDWPADLRPVPAFQTITPSGWLPLERAQTRLLALAFAAITDFDAATDGSTSPEINGELTMPGATRGRYRARRAPSGDGDLVPLMGMPRDDLYGDVDGGLTFTSLPWSEYCGLRARSRLFRQTKLAFEELPQIPLVELSAGAGQGAAMAEKLEAADPLGVAFGEKDASLAAILMGLKESYFLIDTEEEREALLLWRHLVRSSDGAHAIVVTEGTGDQDAQTVHAIFECRSRAR